ncbi:hypothetical protein AgCh_022828 [Apium graveolens]
MTEQIHEFEILVHALSEYEKHKSKQGKKIHAECRSSKLNVVIVGLKRKVVTKKAKTKPNKNKAKKLKINKPYWSFGKIGHLSNDCPSNKPKKHGMVAQANNVLGLGTSCGKVANMSHGVTVMMGNASAAQVLRIGNMDLNATFYEKVFSMKTVITLGIYGDDPTYTSSYIPDHVEKMTNMGVVLGSSPTPNKVEEPRMNKRAKVVKDFGSDFITDKVEDAFNVNSTYNIGRVLNDVKAILDIGFVFRYRSKRMAPKNARVKKIKFKKGRNPGEGNQAALEDMKTNTQADGGQATEPDLHSDSVQATVTTTESEKKRYGAIRGPSTMSKVVIKKAQGKKFKVRCNYIGVSIRRVRHRAGMLARTIIPIDIKSWPFVERELKNKLRKDIQNAFKILEECESLVLKSAGTKWRQFKSDLTTGFVGKDASRKFIAQRITEQWMVKAGRLKPREKPDRGILWKKVHMTKEERFIPMANKTQSRSIVGTIVLRPQKPTTGHVTKRRVGENVGAAASPAKKIEAIIKNEVGQWCCCKWKFSSADSTGLEPQ